VYENNLDDILILGNQPSPSTDVRATLGDPTYEIVSGTYRTAGRNFGPCSNPTNPSLSPKSLSGFDGSRSRNKL
jgi:hypothetical protein